MLKTTLKIMGICFFLLFSLQLSSANEVETEPLISENLLKAANLKMVWDTKLPIRDNERLDRLYLFDNRLYALSSMNYLVGMNRINGDLYFGNTVAPRGIKVECLAQYDGELMALIGSMLIEYNADFGNEIKSAILPFNPQCPVVRNSRYYYAISGIGRLHVLRGDDKLELFKILPDNNSPVNSVLAMEDYILIGSEAGDVFSTAPGSAQRRWSFKAGSAIVPNLVASGNSLFFASKDTKVYRLNIISGRMQWSYQTRAILDTAPRVTETVVYQSVPFFGMVALDRENGKKLWELNGGRDLLAEGQGRAYVITEDKKLVVMDNETGEQLFAVNFAGVELWSSNSEDSKMYIAGRDGRIACIEPAK